MAFTRLLATAAETGINASTVADGLPVTGTGVACEIYTHLTATVALTWAAATRLDVQVQYSYDDVTYYTLPSELVAGVTVTHTNGVEHQLATGGASATMTIDMPINYLYVRLVVEGVGGTTDVASAQMLLGHL